MTFTEEQTLTNHLQHFIACQTISNENLEKVDWREFTKLHALLEAYYSVIYKTFEVIPVGRAGLLFHYDSGHPEKTPLVLSAHQDVVEPGALELWKKEPFSGAYEDGIIWGRGTTDCKHLFLAEMEAVEAAFADGFRPSYDLYIALGYSEEIYTISGEDGGRLLKEALAARGVHQIVLFDEGGSVTTDDKGHRIAHVGLGDKSQIVYELYKDGTGGHSSVPGLRTDMGALARCIVALEDHPRPYKLTDLSRGQLKGMAKLETGDKQRIFSDPDRYWDEVCELARQDARLDALLHTTMCVTMAQGANQPNVIPAHVSATISARVLPGETGDEILAYIQQYLTGGIQVRRVSGIDPVNEDTPDSEEFRLVEQTIHDVYGDDVIVMPELMLFATDSRYYKDIARHIFLFSGYEQDDSWGPMHGVNERIPAAALPGARNFFRRLMENYNA